MYFTFSEQMLVKFLTKNNQLSRSGRFIRYHTAVEPSLRYRGIGDHKVTAVGRGRAERIASGRRQPASAPAYNHCVAF